MGICNCIGRNKQLNSELDKECPIEKKNNNNKLDYDLKYLDRLQKYDNCVWPNKKVKN